MRAWDVITHGGGEGLVYVFNAVAAFFNGHSARGAGSLAATLVFVSGAFGTALATYAMVVKQELRLSFNWFFLSFLVLNCLMLPKVNINVIDRITGLKQPVANVPFMLGAFAGIASQLGDVITKQMDDIFSGPISSLANTKQGLDVMTYRRHGVAMASQLVAKASRFTITDPDMAANLREFVQQCMVFDIAKGKYSIKELLESPNVWQLLQENASQARGFPFRVIANKEMSHQILTCKEGAEKMELAWNEANKQAAKIYGARFFPHHSNPTKTFMANLEISYQYLTQLSLQASDILRQNMMINAIEDGLISFNQITDAQAAITGYAVTRAQEQQKTAYALEGKMASLALSVLKIVIEVVFYGIFPIIVVIAVLPGGLGVLKKYTIALFWIQSWGPLYSILNMLVNTFGKMKSVGAVTGYTGVALSAATLPGLAEANEWIVAVAGYVMMSVPFLSYGLIHYGAGALSQLSTHFGSVTQSAASHAAEEATTGNYNMGNTNFDNHNLHNVSGFKQDTNSMVATGRSSVQLEDGSMASATLAGGNIFDRTSAITKLGGNINFSESLSNSFSHMAEKSTQEAYTQARTAQHSITDAAQKMHDFKQSRSKGTASEQVFAHGESATDQHSFSSYVDKVESFAKENKLSFDEANSLLAKASVGLKLGLPKMFTPSGDVGLSGHNNISDSKTELFNKSKNYAEKEGLTELLQKATTYSQDRRLNQSDSENDAVSSGISTQLSNAQTHISSGSESMAKSHQYREAAQHIASQGVAYNQDLSQQYVNWLSHEEAGGKALGAQGVHHVLSDTQINQRYMEKFVENKGAALWQDYKSHTQTISSPEQNLQMDKDSLNSYPQEIMKSKQDLGLIEPIKSEILSQVNSHMVGIDNTLLEKRMGIETELALNQETLNHKMDAAVIINPIAKTAFNAVTRKPKDIEGNPVGEKSVPQKKDDQK